MYILYIYGFKNGEARNRWANIKNTLSEKKNL